MFLYVNPVFLRTSADEMCDNSDSYCSNLASYLENELTDKERQACENLPTSSNWCPF